MAGRHATLEYLTATKIGEKGQTTVPEQLRKDLRLGTGAPFAVLRLGDGLVLLPEQQRFEHLCEQVGSALAGAGLKPEAMLATLPEARKPALLILKPETVLSKGLLHRPRAPQRTVMLIVETRMIEPTGSS